MNDIILPNNSIVAIKSVRYGTYISACSDNKSVKLVQVHDPNNLPNNCRWTLQTRAQAFDTIGCLNFIGCYGRYLCSRNVDFLGLQKIVCQDNPVGPVSRFLTAKWIHDRFGAAPGNCRLRMTSAGNFLSACGSGALVIVSPFDINCVAPDVYWSIVFISHPQLKDVHIPRVLPSNPLHNKEVLDSEEPPEEPIDWVNGDLPVQQNLYKTVIQVDRVICNSDSGRNINLGNGAQQNGGVEVANTGEI